MDRRSSASDRRKRTLLFATLAASLALAPLCAVAAPAASVVEHSIHRDHMAQAAGHHGHAAPKLASHDAGHAGQHCAPEFCCSAVLGKRAETDSTDRAASAAATGVLAGAEGPAPAREFTRTERDDGGAGPRLRVGAPLRL